MLEIRGHARGGQGMVTAFEILAKTFNQLDDFQVQAFPAFGVERTGAPIQAFLRVAKKEILNRSNIYHPHLIIIFDESLIEQVPVFDGLKPGGAVLINTERPVDRFKGFAEKIYTIPATTISLNHGLGSKSLPIVNAAMIGAILRIFETDLSVGKNIVKANVPAKREANIRSLEDAYNQVMGVKNRNTFLNNCLHAPPEEKKRNLDDLYFDAAPDPEGLAAPFWSAPLSKNQTGNWRLMTPAYVDRTPPCNANCPAGTDVRAFVKQVSERRFQDAFDTIYRHNPFPSICGRVCPNFCEQNCNRNELDQGVNIGAIERFVGDKVMHLQVKPTPLRYKERIAVIGSGPAGLTTALRLREKGYQVTVFEAMPLPGGMMRSGIPRFRLPDEVLDREINIIRQKGVDIILNRKVTIEEVSKDFDAIITAVGSHVSTPLGLANEAWIKDGLHFLMRFKMDGKLAGIKPGDKVAIIGGGNTAIDVSRTVLRLAAKPVVIYRRTINEMPAIAQEVREAQAEGITLQDLTAPVGLTKDGAGLHLELVRMVPGEPDESGRRRSVPIEGSQWSETFDHVITAIGQYFDLYVFGDSSAAPNQGKINYHSDKPVFCAGDMAWGGTVTEAIGSGNKAAEEVDAFFRKKPYDAEGTLPEMVLPKDINFAYFLPSPRHQAPLHHPERFHHDFTEVVKDMDENEIVEETERCLHCGDCYLCGNCFNFCPDAAIYIDDVGRLRIDYAYCKGCGICAQECPCSAIDFKLTEAKAI